MCNHQIDQPPQLRFTIGVERLMEFILPAVISAKAGRRDNEGRGKITLAVDHTGLKVQSSGGNVELILSLHGCIKAPTPGIATVQAVDFQNSLASFLTTTEEVTVSVVPDNKQFDLAITYFDRPLNVEQMQSVPCSLQPVFIPPAQHGSKNFVIRRDEILRAVVVGQAIEANPYRPALGYLAIRVDRGGYRAVAGDGFRFLAYQRQGPGLVKAEGPVEICFGKFHTQKLIKLLKLIDDDELSVSQVVDGVDSQVVLAGARAAIFIKDSPTNLMWPDELRFVESVPVCQSTVRAADLRFLNYRAVGDTDQVQFNINPRLRILTICREGDYGGQRKAVLADVDVPSGNEGPFRVSVPARYLMEIPKHANQRDFVQLELAEQPSLLVVRFLAGPWVGNDLWKRDAAQLTRERLTMFIKTTKEMTHDHND